MIDIEIGPRSGGSGAADGHLLVVGADAAARRAVMAEEGAHHVLESHRSAVGAYGSVRGLLASVVPLAHETAPHTVAEHLFVLLYPMPQLADLIGDGPMTMAEDTPFAERTRYFSNAYIRTISHGIVDFLNAFGAARERAGQPRLTVGFDHVTDADAADQDFLAIALRRTAAVRLLVGTTASGSALPRLQRSIGEHATTRTVGGGRLPPSAHGATLAERYVASDGASDDPHALEVYLSLSEGDRMRLHDARVADLAGSSDPSVAMGAVPWHLERGSGAISVTRRALREVQDECVAKGYSTGAIDAGERGRRITDPLEDPDDFYHFTAKMASALVPHGELDRCEELYRELLRSSISPKVHMTGSYAIAMLHTRFYRPRDHDRALELINQGRAIASTEPDPVERACLEVYQENGLALVEMHRGNLERSLMLVREGLARLAMEVPAERWRLHRTQLMHNQARVLVALERHDEALETFSALIDQDPYYVDYRADRGNLHRRMGDLAKALDDYDWAIAYQPPFAEMHFNRAQIHLEYGATEAAVADLEVAVGLEPALVDAWIALVTVLVEDGQPERAARWASAGLAEHRDNPELWCVLADAEADRGNVDLASSALDAALELDGGLVPALGRRAAICFDAGRFDDAIVDLDAALRPGPDPDLLLNRGLAYEASGRLDDAIADFTAAMEIPDGDTEVLQMLMDRCLAGRS